MTTDQPDEIISIGEAARLLDAGEEQVRAMVDQGLLSPVGDGDGPRFRRSEVLAAAEMGG